MESNYFESKEFNEKIPPDWNPGKCYFGNKTCRPCEIREEKNRRRIKRAESQDKRTDRNIKQSPKNKKRSKKRNTAA